MVKNLLRILLTGLFCFTLLGCTNENKLINLGEKSKYVLNNNLVSLNIKVKSLTNSKATLNLVNHTNETYIYGDAYLIECQKDGIWYKIIPINDMNFNMIAYVLKPKKSKEITIDWEYHYGKLNPGKYRIIKDVSLDLDRVTEASDYVYISVEFEIK